MEASFTPSGDVNVILNALLDKYENRVKWNPENSEGKEYATRSIRVSTTDIHLPTYFSQTDPAPRLIANEQLVQLEEAGLLNLVWLPGEKGHLLQSVTLQANHGTRNILSRSEADSLPKRSGVEWTHYATLYTLLNREPASATRSRLESTLLADQFRFSKDDWRTRAIHRTRNQLRAGKSPAPFSLTDSAWNLDLLTVLSALPSLETETPYRVFSVHTFNDSKRFDELKPAIVRLARLATPEWKSLPAEDILREFNLVANPNYIHIAGNWQLTTESGEILSLGGFTPSVGFPAAQIKTIQSVTVRASRVLCIENLTSFHGFLRAQETTQRNTQHAILCLMGNPSPSIRQLLHLVPETIPIHLWSDMDYGGFNILSQMRRYVRDPIHPYMMDISTFEKYAHLSHPLTQADVRNLKHLLARPELADVRTTINYLIHRGLKLEQEAILI